MSFWPPPYQAAISLTFDDGDDSQYHFAVPVLNSYPIRGTFYLNPRCRQEDASYPDTWEEYLERWRMVRQAGHEIGSHTILHPCSLNIHAAWLEGKNHLFWTLERMEQDILESKRRIESAYPDQGLNSFAYPCYESSVGRGMNKQSYVPVVARNHIAGRGRGELRGELANDPEYCDLHYLSSWAVERQPGAFMVGLVEQALALGLWGIFTIHGIHEGHLPIGDTDFLELVEHLNRRKDIVWIAPVMEIAAYIQART